MVEDILTDVDKATSKTPETMDHVNYSMTNVRDISDNLKTIINEVEESIDNLKATLSNVEIGSRDVPDITKSTKRGILEIRHGVEDINKVVLSLQNNFLIQPNIPAEPEIENMDAGLRE